MAKPKRKGGQRLTKALTNNSSIRENDLSDNQPAGDAQTAPSVVVPSGAEGPPAFLPKWWYVAISLSVFGGFEAGAWAAGNESLTVMGIVVWLAGLMTSVAVGLFVVVPRAGPSARANIVQFLTSRDEDSVYGRRVMMYALMREGNWLLSDDAPDVAKKTMWSLADKFADRVLAKVYGFEGAATKDAQNRLMPPDVDERQFVNAVDAIWPPNDPKAERWNKGVKGIASFFRGRQRQRQLPPGEDQTWLTP